MDSKVLTNLIVFSGVLDETVKYESLELAFLEYKNNQSSSDYFCVDFSKVLYANSSGIIFWLRFLDKNEYSLRYINCPVWLVNQFNMLTGFFGNESFVESIQIPYYSEETKESSSVLFHLGKDIPLKKDYSEFTLENKDILGVNFEPDVMEEQYLSFISSNKDSFQKIIKIN